MLKIITTSGDEIDVKPGNTIEFEMENPIFQTEYIPTTFSTSFRFPSSDRNKVLLGYLPALKMPPSVTKLDVSLVLDGIEIASGMMEYEGIEEDSGDLEYTFSCKSVEEILTSKIHEVAHPYTSSYVNVVTPSIASSDKPTPMGYGVFAIKIKDILAQIEKVDIEDIDDLYVLATYGDSNTLPSSRRLPDVTFSELLKATSNLFCMALFVDGDKYSLKYIKDILGSPDFLDWSTMVSDKFEAGRIKARGYKLKYSNSETSPSSEAAASAEEGVSQVLYLKNMIAGAVMGEYKAYRVSYEGGDTYSINMFQTKLAGGDTIYKRRVDLIAHAGNSYEKGASDKLEVDIPFKLAECVPLEYIHGNYTAQAIREWTMCPLLPKVDKDNRTSEMIIGEIRNSQFVDKRATFYPLYPTDNTNGEAQYAVASTHDWSASRVFSRFHSKLADFIAEDRQTISADVNLSPRDINIFRLWQKVRFSNREWLVKKLTFTISTSRGIISSRGEFVEI